MDKNMRKLHRSSDGLLTDALKTALVAARWRALDAVERGDISHDARWSVYGIDALMQGRDFAELALYRAAESFFNSGRLS